MKVFKYFFLAGMALLFMNCHTYNQRVLNPVVSLNSFDIERIDLDGVNIIARLDVRNPNRFSIPMPSVGWELFVNSNPSVSGVVIGNESIIGRETIVLDVPVNFTFESLYSTFSHLINAEEVEYQIALGVSFPVPEIINNVHNLDFSGILPIPQIPRLTFASVSVADINFSSIALAGIINVENPNTFPIPFPEIDWGFGINGTSIIDSRNPNAGMIAAGEVAAASMNMDIAFEDILAVADFVGSETESSLSFAAALPFPFSSIDGNVLYIPLTIPILQKPEISFQGITRRALGRTMEFVLNWEVTNRNDFDFEIEAFDYNFLVNNRSWAEGQALNPPVIGAGSRTVIPVAISISAPVIVAEIVDIINRGAIVNYVATGYICLFSGLPGLDIPDFSFNFTGNTRIR